MSMIVSPKTGLVRQILVRLTLTTNRSKPPLLSPEKLEEKTMLNSLRSFVHMLRLPKPDYEVYCREKRLERYEKNGGQVGT